MFQATHSRDFSLRGLLLPKSVCRSLWYSPSVHIHPQTYTAQGNMSLNAMESMGTQPFLPDSIVRVYYLVEAVASVHSSRQLNFAFWSWAKWGNVTATGDCRSQDGCRSSLASWLVTLYISQGLLFLPSQRFPRMLPGAVMGCKKERFLFCT